MCPSCNTSRCAVERMASPSTQVDIYGPKLGGYPSRAALRSPNDSSLPVHYISCSFVFILRRCLLLGTLTISGLLAATHVYVGWRIIGSATSCFATPIIRTRCDTSPNSNCPNWVGRFYPSLVCRACLLISGMRFL